VSTPAGLLRMVKPPKDGPQGFAADPRSASARTSAGLPTPPRGALHGAVHGGAMNHLRAPGQRDVSSCGGAGRGVWREVVDPRDSGVRHLYGHVDPGAATVQFGAEQLRPEREPAEACGSHVVHHRYSGPHVQCAREVVEASRYAAGSGPPLDRFVVAYPAARVPHRSVSSGFDPGSSMIVSSASTSGASPLLVKATRNVPAGGSSSARAAISEATISSTTGRRARSASRRACSARTTLSCSIAASRVALLARVMPPAASAIRLAEFALHSASPELRTA